MAIRASIEFALVSAKRRQALFSFFLRVLIYVILLAIFCELGLRYFAEPHSNPPLHQLRTDVPYLFDLNPDHKEINDLGFRISGDRAYASKDKIAILGDSVVYGLFVLPQEAFPSVLQRKLEESAEVINAGVNGYTLYNTKHFYRERIQPLHPKVVILSLCLNDVVNPIIHWNEPKLFSSLPLEAYPQGLEGKQKAGKWVKKQESFLYKLMSSSAIFRFVDHVAMLYHNRSYHVKKIKGRSWPVHLADESRQSIEVYQNLESREWKWLRQNILELKTEVENAGSQFVLLFLPLAYQVDRDYPLSLNLIYEKFCQENQLQCVNPLEELRARNKKDLFMNQHRHHLRDVWHFSPKGHEVVAESLFRFLEK